MRVTLPPAVTASGAWLGSAKEQYLRDFEVHSDDELKGKRTNMAPNDRVERALSRPR